MSSPAVSGPRDPQLLERAHAMMVPALAETFAATLARADDALFDRAEQAGPAQMRFLDGMREMRRRGGQIAGRFRAHLDRAWRALAEGTPLSAEAVLSGPAAEGLSLVGEDELESRLAVRNLASVLQREAKAVLARMEPRLGWVAGVDALAPDTDPVGPDHIGVAVHEALASAELAAEVRLVLFKLFERALVGAVTSLYPALDAALLKAGVLPDLGRQGRASASPPPAAAAFAADEEGPGAPPPWASRFLQRWAQAHGIEAEAGGGGGSGGEPGAAPGGYGASQAQGLMLEALHELLEQSRQGRGQAGTGAQAPGAGPGTAGGGAGSGRSLSQREMLSVLSLLQAAPSATLSAALGENGESLAQRLKSEVLSGVSQLGVDPASARLDPVDEDAIDLVGMLFDVMLDERELEGRSRELIGRLVVPFVKVALLDRKMFVHKTHPARRLLNSLAEACEGNTGQTPAEQALMGKVEEVVDRLVAEFNENLAIFLTLEEEFREFLARHRRKIEIAERRAAEAQRGQEKLEQARQRATGELDSRLDEVSLPPALDDFMRQAWTHHLTLLLLREGEDGAGVAEALALADGVLDELSEARRHVVGKPWLQAWQPALRKVLASVGLQGEACDASIDVLHGALQAIAEHQPQEALRPLPESARSAVAASNLPPAAAAPMEPPPVAANGGGFDDADAERFRQMEIGTWLDFIDRDGKVQPGKLSWISPISARRLFVNRRGVRFCVASPEELAMMVKLGRLRPHVGGDAFDSALQGVIERLETPSDAPSHTLH
ncbi:DUF1631 domain-containing protein [Xanthomonas massiliensis]|uniref:DUF1631 domain-containing protein n=1 Tax=Xanthomonas massiliensis TaxID=1720302 RepID=UPI000824C94E|nr:DUF1631 domain-containing protein [Xanthomonas massiliensis]